MSQVATSVKPQVKDDQGKVPISQGRVKEAESKSAEKSAFEAEEKLMTEIKTTAEAADRQALESLKGAVSEIKRSVPEPELPPDVEDAGVINPQTAADNVVAKGATIELPTDQGTYERGQHTKVSGKSDDKNAVFGTASLVAFALWIGRLIKMAHKSAKRIIWKGTG